MSDGRASLADHAPATAYRDGFTTNCAPCHTATTHATSFSTR